MKEYIFDIEADAIYATKIHCLSYYEINKGVSGSISSYEDIKNFFKEEAIWVGHNIVRYDLPTIERIIGIKVRGRKIDTLALSWYLFFEKKRHGLEAWGEEFNIKKPEIDDWENLPIEEYIHRCEEDVKINTQLWKRQKSYLSKLYENSTDVDRLCNYLSFKLDCVREQEEIGVRLDVEKCTSTMERFAREEEVKISEIEAVMPKVAIKKINTYKDVIKTTDGNIACKGDLFFQAAIDTGGKIEKEITLEKIKGWKDPNANSHEQIKDWLYSIGWVPEHIKHVRDKKTNEVKKIPQIGAKEGQGELCDSVKKLFEKEPKLSVLDGLSVISHRISVLKAFLKDQRQGRLYPSMAGLTNTLRLQHSIIVNLPGIDKKYGREIRECIIADEGSVLVNSDLSNIEDRTKRHYIYKYDPKYVEDMNTPGYDAHLEIALLAGFMTKDDVSFYKECESRKKKKGVLSKEEESRWEKLKGIRGKSKITNFSATYKVGKDALSRNSGMKLKDAAKLLKIYWQRNKAILQIEDDTITKTIGEKKWLYNPISKYWYSLRNDKDKFSTLNQGSAVYVFDIWLTYLRQRGVIVPFQYHDEILCNIKVGDESIITMQIEESIKDVNNRLKLNIEVGCSINMGDNYADIH